jgi:hypothetical protein
MSSSDDFTDRLANILIDKRFLQAHLDTVLAQIRNFGNAFDSRHSYHESVRGLSERLPGWNPAALANLRLSFQQHERDDSQSAAAPFKQRLLLVYTPSLWRLRGNNWLRFIPAHFPRVPSMCQPKVAGGARIKSATPA